MEWPNGSKYQGGYNGDLKHGVGTFTWPDGRIYRGQWVDGKQEGQGVSISKDGKQQLREWRRGKPIFSDTMSSAETMSCGSKQTEETAAAGVMGFMNSSSSAKRGGGHEAD